MPQTTPTDRDAYDWRSRVLSEVAAADLARKRRVRTVTRITLDIPPGALIDLVREAAARRGSSVTGYARRALIAYVARDLDIPFLEVNALDPRFSPARTRQTVIDLEGKLGGPWGLS